MSKIYAAFWSEFKKIQHANILWITITGFIFIPVMMGLMMYIVRHPEISAKLGIIAAKASLFGAGDWTAFFGLLNQMMATAGFIGFGFITAWVFGREYTERTLKDLLALPVPRSYIVFSKFIVVLLWCLILALLLFITGICTGKIASLPGWTTVILYHGIYRFSATTFLTILLSTPVAFIACYGRGFLAPLGLVIITMILSQFIAIAGLGAFFPWAIPGLYTTIEGPSGMQLYTGSYILLIITSGLGYWGTLTWWQKADQT